MGVSPYSRICKNRTSKNSRINPTLVSILTHTDFMLRYFTILTPIILADFFEQNLDKIKLPTQWKCTDKSVSETHFGTPVRLNRYGHIECFYDSLTNQCQTSNTTQTCNDMMHRLNKVRTTRVLDCDSLKPKFL